MVMTALSSYGAVSGKGRSEVRSLLSDTSSYTPLLRCLTYYLTGSISKLRMQVMDGVNGLSFRLRCDFGPSNISRRYDFS